MTNKEEQGARLLEIIKYFNYTQKAFGQSIDVRQSYITQLVNGKKPISGFVINNITVRYPTVSIEWLLTGQGEMMKSQNLTHNQLIAHTTFGSNLSLLRSLNGLSAEELALRINTHHSIISDWETGRQGPVIDPAILDLRELFGVSLDDLLFSDLSSPENMTQLEKGATPETNKIEGKQAKLEQALKAVQQALKEISQRLDRLENPKKKT